MSRLKCHHRPRVFKSVLYSDWFSHCDSCLWARRCSNWHLAFVAALDHAESSLR